MLSKVITKLVSKTVLVTDRRINFTSELISGNLAVKMLGWEDPLTEKVRRLRKDENDLLQRTGRIRGTNIALQSLNHTLALSVIFITVFQNLFVKRKVSVPCVLVSFYRRRVQIAGRTFYAEFVGFFETFGGVWIFDGG